jgi:hypothetical protein
MNPVRTPLFAAPRIVAETAADGSLLLRSADPLGSYPPTVLHSLRAWAEADPAPRAGLPRRPGRAPLRRARPGQRRGGGRPR